MMSRAAMYSSIFAKIGGNLIFSFSNFFAMFGFIRSSNDILPHIRPAKSSVFRCYKTLIAPSKYTWSLYKPPGSLVSYIPRFSRKANLNRFSLPSMYFSMSSNSSTKLILLA